MLFALTATWVAIAHAQLPPLSPEEAARKQMAAEKKARDEATAKAALARAQNRVVERYRNRQAVIEKKHAKPAEMEMIPESEAAIEE
jgi:hypothetical protein